MIRESVSLPARSPASGANVVTAMSRDAARAGAGILRDGGNAVDAAVAAALASGVSEPSMSGLGGTAYAVVFAGGRVEAIQGIARAPLAASEDMFEPLAGVGGGLYGFPPTRGDRAETGPTSICAPTAPAVLDALHGRFGRLPRERVAEPAIRMAEDGFVPDWAFFAHRAAGARRLAKCPAAARLHVQGDGFQTPGAPLRNPDLARSLRAFARDGAAPFREGEQAERLLAGESVLTRADLKGETRWEEPLRFRYRGLDVATLGGSSGGPTLAQTLLHLDALEPGDEVRFLHRLAQSLRLAFEDRFERLPGPVAPLLDPDYLAGRRAGGRTAVDPSRAADGDCTTHVNAVDQDGMAVALTATLGGRFGSAWTVPGLGYPINNGMMWFDPRPGTRVSAAPGRLALHAATGLMAFDGDGLAAVAGAPGGRRLISAASLLMARVFEQGRSMRDAAGGPRMHCDVGAIDLDERAGNEIADGLRRLGHEVRAVEETVLTGYFGRASGLKRAADGFEAGVDPIRTAAAAAMDTITPSNTQGATAT